MSKRRDTELERAETWDFERPEVREPVKASRVVVSVAFRRDDFASVSEYAERVGKRISEFIREAAIEKATGHGGVTLFSGGGGTVTLWGTQQIPAITIAYGSREVPEESAVITY